MQVKQISLLSPSHDKGSKVRKAKGVGLFPRLACVFGERMLLADPGI